MVRLISSRRTAGLGLCVRERKPCRARLPGRAGPRGETNNSCHVHPTPVLEQLCQTASTGPVPVVHGVLIVVSTTTLQFSNIHANVQRINQAVWSGH